MRLSKSQKGKVQRSLENHDFHKNCYFWSGERYGRIPPKDVRDTIAEERSFTLEFTNAGRRYQYTSRVSITRANYYYYGEFTLDGEKENVRLFRNLLK